VRRAKGLNRSRNAPLLLVVSDERDAALQGLATAVAELLDASNRVCFKLEQEQMLLAGARNAWISEATNELEDAVGEFTAAERQFLGHLSAAAGPLGAPPEATLREISMIAEEPWNYIFSEGANELRQIFGRVEQHKAGLREMLTRNYLAASSALQVLGVSTPTAYDASGTPSSSGTPSVLFNTRV
jgi:hypothetical protein